MNKRHHEIHYVVIHACVQVKHEKYIVKHAKNRLGININTYTKRESYSVLSSPCNMRFYYFLLDDILVDVNSIHRKSYYYIA